MADVFISYRNTPERRALVRRLAAILRAHEITVWWDYGLEAGESYRAQITTELANARVVVPLWCAESVNSRLVCMEAELGKDKLVPARLQKVVPPDAFEAIQAADLIGWDGAVGSPPVLAFVRRICKRLGRAAIAPTDMIEELAHLPVVPPLPEVVPIAVGPASLATGPGHDYAFWERQWDRYGTSDNLIALRDIADAAPRIFANQARVRMAEIEAAQQRQAEERERQARDRADAEQRVAAFLAEGRIEVDATILHGNSKAARAGWFKPSAGKSEWFKDLDTGPEMVVPGNPAFAIGRFALTFAGWDAAQAHPEWQKHSGISPRKPNDHSWGRSKQPVIDVSWNDAKAYCGWLSAVTRKTYRLPSDAEWEHACRAGTMTDFWWGDKISTAQANYNGSDVSGDSLVPCSLKRGGPWPLRQ
jgi:Sulfatase-modifying factor enzyme 1/TIR domain